MRIALLLTILVLLGVIRPRMRWVLLGLFVICSVLVGRSHAAELPIHWVRVNDMPQWEVRDGVCVVYMPVSSHTFDEDDEAMEPLVRGCLAKGGLTGKGDFTLVWDVLETTREVEAAERIQYPVQRPMPGGHENYQSETLGFYVRKGSVCHVTTARTAHVLGHEVRHCYDGNWHL